MIPVKDQPDWAKSGPALVNVDVEGYQKYIQKRNAAELARSRMDNMETTINNLSNQVSALSDTMNQILNLLKK